MKKFEAATEFNMESTVIKVYQHHLRDFPVKLFRVVTFTLFYYIDESQLRPVTGLKL